MYSKMTACEFLVVLSLTEGHGNQQQAFSELLCCFFSAEIVT